MSEITKKVNELTDLLQAAGGNVLIIGGYTVEGNKGKTLIHIYGSTKNILDNISRAMDHDNDTEKLIMAAAAKNMFNV